MACYKPLSAYKALNMYTREYKNRIIIIGKKDRDDYQNKEEFQYLELPCGQCIGCRLDRSRNWAIRCVHEASLYDHNCFITLTFDDENLNSRSTLVKSDFQKFMKRLRKKYSGMEKVIKNGKSIYPIRYFHCGEYGSLLERPHHHACLFNFDFPKYDKDGNPDKVLWSVKNKIRLYRSASLEKLWPYGFCTIGDVTFDSAAYVARYITKKITGDQAASHYFRVDNLTGEMYYAEPEYTTMSRRPGIGKNWLEKFQTDLYPKDFITLNGKIFNPPAYYDKIYDANNSENFADIKRKRLTKAKKYADNTTVRRLRDRNQVAELNFNGKNERNLT